MTKPTVLATVAAGAAAAFIHAPPHKRVNRRHLGQALQCRLRLLPEDRALLHMIATSHNISPSDVVAHAWTLFCRALRTGRDPLTGECIDWKASVYREDIPTDLRDFLAESRSIVSDQIKRKARPLFDR